MNITKYNNWLVLVIKRDCVSMLNIYIIEYKFILKAVTFFYNKLYILW